MKTQISKKIITCSIIFIIIVATLSYVVFTYVNDPVFDTGLDETTDPDKILDKKVLPDSFNIYLIGMDEGGIHSDALMLINVDASEQKITMLSIPRDTKVSFNGKDYKINSMYAIGGLELLIEKTRQLTGTPIHYYMVIRPGMLSDVVDALGGVQFEVEQDMYYSDPVQNLYINLKKGDQLLSGDQFEQYCRYRSYIMGDLTRTQSQQKIFKALIEQKINSGNINKLINVFEILKDDLITNVTVNDILKNCDGVFNCQEICEINIPGEYNEMEKEGICYYIIRDKDLELLHHICRQNFMAETV